MRGKCTKIDYTGGVGVGGDYSLDCRQDELTGEMVSTSPDLVSSVGSDDDSLR